MFYSCSCTMYTVSFFCTCKPSNYSRSAVLYTLCRFPFFRFLPVILQPASTAHYRFRVRPQVLSSASDRQALHKSKNKTPGTKQHGQHQHFKAATSRQQQRHEAIRSKKYLSHPRCAIKLAEHFPQAIPHEFYSAHAGSTANNPGSGVSKIRRGTGSERSELARRAR